MVRVTSLQSDHMIDFFSPMMDRLMASLPVVRWPASNRFLSSSLYVALIYFVIASTESNPLLSKPLREVVISY